MNHTDSKRSASNHITSSHHISIDSTGEVGKSLVNELESADSLSGEVEDMAAMKMPADEELARWTEELQEIDAQIASLSERKLSIQKVFSVLAYVEKLRGNGNGEAAPAGAPIGMKLIDAIPLALQKAGRPLSPADIKKALADIGYTTEHGDGYFYTAIKRSVDKQRIIRTADRRYVVSAFASNNESYARPQRHIKD